MERQTIGVDLGASYTKVAYRSPLKRYGKNKFAEVDSEVAVIDGTATIPSLLIKTNDRRKPWIIGADAAGTRPDSQMEVFENWKSALYTDEFNASKVKLVTLAGHFFGWLSNRLNQCQVDVNNCRVRVTIPGLKRIEDRKDALIECMRLNGWPNEIDVVKEPVANLIGVLSRGNNFVTAAGRMNYCRTIGNSDGMVDGKLSYVFREIRNFAQRQRSEKNMIISIVDFGSFTLDVAKMMLDLNVIEYDQFPLDNIYEESWEIGVIENIDKRCLAKILTNQQINEQNLPFETREAAKAALYSDNEFAVPGTRVVLGRSDADKEVVRGSIEDYCQKVWSNIATHCKDSEVVVLTGGGVSIPLIRDFINGKLHQVGVRNIEDISPNADDVMLEPHKNCTCDWQVSGQGLERLATCLGAASIGLGFRPDDYCRRFIRT